MQNKTIDMEKTTASLFPEHQKTRYGTLELGLEIKYSKRPSGLRTKTLITAVVILIALIMCLFLGSLFYLTSYPKDRVLHYRAICAVENYVAYNKTIPYLLQTDDLDSSMKIFMAPQIFEDLMDDFPYGYFFREEIEFHIMYDNKIHSIVINIVDVMNSFSTRFVHNLKKNHTAIVDFNNNRCFIMKLNHNVTMIAHELLLSMQRMENIYPTPHGIQLVLPKRIVLPAVADLSFADKQMVKDCHDKYVYILTDFRPEDDDPVDLLITKDGHFYEFFGRGITEYSLINLDEILLYEKQL